VYSLVRNWVVVLPTFWLASCLPRADLSSYSGSDQSGGAGGVPGAAGSGDVGGSGGSSSSPPDAAVVNTSEFPGANAGGLDAGLSFVGLDASASPAPFVEDAAVSAVSGGDAGPGAFCAAPGLTGPNGNCYLMLATPRSWSDARSGCLALGQGWDLASIRSGSINSFLSDALSFEVWIGGSDAATEGTWIWVIDGSPFWSGDGATGAAVAGAFNSWNTSEPNGATNSDCARLLPGSLVAPGAQAIWADLECGQLRGSVCERPAP
jgi:lectin-like protein